MSKYNFAFEAKFIKSEIAFTNSSVPLGNSLGDTVKEMPHCLLNISKVYERGKHSTLCFIFDSFNNSQMVSKNKSFPFSNFRFFFTTFSTFELPLIFFLRILTTPSNNSANFSPYLNIFFGFSGILVMR